jgi:hypothetical protein
MIDKIKVIPKRKSQQLCSGFLYIVEDLWCLHSSDLEVNTIAGNLILQQQYANILVDAWMPVSHKLQMEVEFAGVRADITYVSSLKYKSTVLNPNLPKSYFEPVNIPTQPDEALIEETEEQKRIQEILKKEEINDRDMARLTKLMEKETEKADPDTNKLEVEGTKFSVAPNAVMNDSTFWNEIRPVPLTNEERTTLATRDSIFGFGDESLQARRDSISSSRKPKIRSRDFIIGKTFQSRDRRFKLTYGGLVDLSTLSFNTVDGLVYGQNIGVDYRPDRSVAYRAKLNAGYAFARRAPMLKWTSDILYAPKIRGKIALNMNYKSEDFNSYSGIPSFTNSVYSLFLRENYSKRYENISATLEHRMDLATGFVFYATLDLANRSELSNNSDFSFLYRNSRSYTENYPATYDSFLPMFESSKQLAGQIRLEYTHEYYYRLRRGRKQYFKSEYPTIYAVYRQSMPIENAGWADYALVYAGLKHEKELGLLSKLDYKIEGGYFLNNSQTHFSDYVHFKESPLLLDMMGLEESFHLLDHYRASTNEYFIQAHGRLTSSFLVLKLLPWFSERLWSESLSLNYLLTPDVDNHIQLGYSIDEIGFLFDIGIFAAFEEWKYYGTALHLNFRF